MSARNWEDSNLRPSVKVTDALPPRHSPWCPFASGRRCAQRLLPLASASRAALPRKPACLASLATRSSCRLVPTPRLTASRALSYSSVVGNEITPVLHKKESQIEIDRSLVADKYITSLCSNGQYSTAKTRVFRSRTPGCR